MKLWLISQSVNNGYDTYDSIVVAAETENEAKNMHPAEGILPPNEWRRLTWCQPQDVQVQYLGEADSSITAGVICASFNAG